MLKNKFKLPVYFLVSFVSAYISTANGFSHVETDIKPSEISLSNYDLTLEVGEKYFLDVSFSPENVNIKNLTYIVDNPLVVSIDNNGVIEALAVGSAKIEVIPANTSIKKICNINVTKAKIKQINLVENSIDLIVDQQRRILYTILPTNVENSNLLFESSDPSIASVDTSGIIVANSAGKVIIKVYSEDKSIFSECVVTVYNKPTDLVFPSSEVILNIEETYKIEYSILPDSVYNTNITWSSSDTSVAEVSNLGVVTSKNKGNATITGKIGDEIESSFNLVVKDDFEFTFSDIYNGYFISGVKDTTLSNLSFPANYKSYSVIGVGEEAFINNSVIKKITMPSAFSIIDDSAFENCSNLETISFNSSLVEIHSRAFYSCDKLELVKLPDELQSVADEAFCESDNLREISFASNISNIGQKCFYNCQNLTKVVFANNTNISTINSSTFEKCSNLTTFNLPKSINSIESRAFYDCVKLEKINFDSSNLTSIGESAFYNCLLLNNVILPNSLTSIGSYAFYKCSLLSNISLPSNNSFNIISSYTFSFCSSLETITIPDSVTMISTSAFDNCTSLTNIIFSSSLSSIYPSALSNCTSLVNVTLPSNITFVHRETFSNCSNLVSVDIPNSVTAIESKAFYNCEKLEEVSYSTSSNNIEKIDTEAFANCASLTSFNVPSKLQFFSEGIFRNCTNLSNLIFSENSQITSIGDNAFNSCSSLEKMFLPASVTQIGSGAFSSSGISEIFYGGLLESEFNNITIGSDNDPFNNAKIYYYSYDEPDEESTLSYWHYNNGEIEIWA